MWCRWRFVVQELSRGHMVSVARGPPDAAVDAIGVRLCCEYPLSVKREGLPQTTLNVLLGNVTAFVCRLSNAPYTPKTSLMTSGRFDSLPRSLLWFRPICWFFSTRLVCMPCLYIYSLKGQCRLMQHILCALACEDH